jgi:ADP-heptose:LPS heptosyltransferase
MSQSKNNDSRRKQYERRLQQKQALDRRRSGKPDPVSKKSAKTPVLKMLRDGTVAKTSRTPGSSIFLSGGLGDVFAIESFLSSDMRKKLNTVCYGTRKAASIKKCFEALKNYPSLKNHQIVWNDFSDFWCFMSKADCDAKMRQASVKRSKEMILSEDYSILQLFPRIRSGEFKYNYSSFLIQTVADIGRFALPKRFVCVCPYSSDKRLESRDFSRSDWDLVLAFLEKNGVAAVVLNDREEYVPTSPRIVNLSGKTTPMEAIEVLKASRAYIGIDSSLSVLAAKRFTASQLSIKSFNDHCYINKEIYYAPLTDFKFLNRGLSLDHLELDEAITVRTAQGLGDIYWVYQKFEPYFKKINIEICVLDFDIVSRRSEDWLKLFPHVQHVGYHLVTSEEYQKLASSKPLMKDVFTQWDAGANVVDYCPNTWLEQGTRIEDIDEFDVQIDVPIAVEPFDLPFSEYVTLYVSGSTKAHGAVIQGAWSVDEWVAFVEELYSRYSIELPLIIIGAEFDREVMLEVKQRFAHRKTHMFVQSPPAKVMHVLANTTLFIGYQSGLNIMADALDRPQIMLNFNYLEPMCYTWCRKENIATKFHAFIFGMRPSGVLAGLQANGFTV